MAKIAKKKPKAVVVKAEPNVRIWYEKRKSDGKKTGRTFVVMKSPDCISVGISRCGSADTFCRKIGRQVAQGRAELAWEKFQTNHRKDEVHCIVTPKSSSKEVMAFAFPHTALDLDMSTDMSNTVLEGITEAEGAQLFKRFKQVPKWLLEDKRKNP